MKSTRNLAIFRALFHSSQKPTCKLSASIFIDNPENGDWKRLLPSGLSMHAYSETAEFHSLPAEANLKNHRVSTFRSLTFAGKPKSIFYCVTRIS